MARILPPTEKEPGWKAFGAFPDGWNRGPAASLQHALPAGMRVAAGIAPTLAAGAHPFIARAFARPTSSAVLRVAAGAVCAEPLLLSTVFAPGATRAVPVTEIRVGARARCVIDERIGASAGQDASLVSSTVLRLGAGADVTWRTTVTGGAGLLAFLHRHVILGPGSTARLDLEVEGGARVQVVSTQTLAGRGATASMATAARCDGDARFVHRVLQEAFAPSCTIRLTERVVATDRARAVFLGGMHLSPKAQLADGQQSHRALLLSDDAASSATPSLEIEADDVRCSHGATTSRIDDDQRFYLLSRGIPEDESVRMLVDAFLAQAALTPLAPAPVPAGT